jgi:GNAT superfamily N-acetyltransferase|eukprot:g3213.t1
MRRRKGAAEDRAVRVRPYEKRDRGEVLGIFADGMKTTIESGFRNKILKKLGMIWSFVVLGAAYFLAATCWWRTTVLLVLLGGVVPYVVLFVFPRYIANDYVDECIRKKDLKDVQQYYMSRDRCNFWVAETAESEIVGCVALDEILPENAEGWKVGDAELRRMSVKKSARGMGLATLLIAELESFCRTKNYKRIVLSTSEMQVAAKKMYVKKFQFEEERFHDWHGIIRIHFFAKALL